MLTMQTRCCLLLLAAATTLSACNVHDADALADSDDKSAEEGKHTNLLADETSPYLLLHAHNPVNWRPWGPEAFEAAKRENKPIFLSIGYSSCYWCHVMERKVFENEEIAKLMNKYFINIKVDREERPDVDDVYMTAVHVYFQAIGSPQGGGWPLSMFLTPDGKPFAGGTYFPPEDEAGRTGFKTVIQRVNELWTTKRKGVEDNADVITAEVRRIMKPGLELNPPKLERSLVSAAVAELIESYDPEYGGLDFRTERPDGPKFPVPVKLAALQYQVAQTGDKQAADVLEKTLDEIARGGIRDHLAGGFHRYSTDRRWYLPHFEKMLYDQSQLADVYLTAYEQTGKRLYKDVAVEIHDFVLERMTAMPGGFHSALDAETEGIEGKFYVWTEQEIDKVLGDEAELFKQIYGAEGEPSFEHGHVLYLPKSIAAAAKKQNIPEPELRKRLAAARGKLLAARRTREPLLEDDKILTSWNGLMIRALANAGRVLKRPDYIAAAEKAASFILNEMRDDQGNLLRTSRNGKAKLNAYLDDYAFLVDGVLALHKATGDAKWKNVAVRLTDDQLRLFHDDKAHGFFFTSHGHEALIARTKNAADAVIPSGNSVSVRNLLELYKLTGKKKYLDHARGTLEVFAGPLKRAPRGMANMAVALGEYLDVPADADDSSNSVQSAVYVADAPSEENASREKAKSDAKTPTPDGSNTSAIVQVKVEVPDKENAEIVTASAYLSVDKLPNGGKCRIVLFANVKKGWHINTNPADPDFLVPTKFTIESEKGVKLINVKYPKGKALTVKGFDKPVHCYDDSAAFYAELEVPATNAAEDEITIKLRYQACNDDNCLAPKTIKLKGKVPIARAGATPKEVNENLFPKPRPRAAGKPAGKP